MKIVSWNVNGIESRRKSLIKLLNNSKPDIFCAQEVKKQCSLNTPGYEAYWNLAERQGYAGTLILSRRKPIACTYGIGVEKFDIEGRVITLEFNDFFLVSTYVPSYNTASAPERREYREEWDVSYQEYVSQLPKPAILCGDFNTVRSNMDTYSNRVNENDVLHFQPEDEFRENFEKLLNSGFVDVFRTLNPEKEGVYSWWGPKNKNRLENRGSRLDYILVSPKLLGHVINIKYHTDTLGSDHCPVSISIIPPTLYARGAQENLSARWQTIDWSKAHEFLYSMQKNLAQAAYMRDWELVSHLQQKLVNSWPAKALAVRAVADNNTAAGVDGIKWETDAEKAEAAESLTSRGYRPLPYRHKEIVDDNGRHRIIHIPAARDKAMQVLYSYALDPVAESTADKRSFSARKGRSGLDVHAYLLKDLQAESGPEWLMIGDIESYYSKITHKRLIEDIPMDKEVLRKFLRAGVVRDGELFETSQGISLGTSLSPILANMLLDGLQSYIYDHLYPDGSVEYIYGCMTRFADDIIVYAKSEEQANVIFQIVSSFLSERGLRLSPVKSRIINIREGFDFLARHYQKNKDVIEVTPADEAVKRFEKKLEDLILNDKSSYRVLIGKINSKLTKWDNHHRASDAYMTFRHIDAVVEGLLLRKMRDRHPHWHWHTVLDKYWRKEGNYRVFVLPEDPSVRIVRLAPLNIVQHKPCRLDFNPYMDQEYYMFLKRKRDMQKAVGKYNAVWERQGGKCAYCGLAMLPDQEVEVVERTIGQGWKVQNLIYVHKQCGLDQFISAGDSANEHIDLFELLSDLIEDSPITESPYWGLREYFRLCDKPVVSLTFSRIEELIGEKLGWEAEFYEEFWYDGYNSENAATGWQEENRISHAVKPEAPAHRIAESWISQGYRLQRLHLAERRAVFHRAVMGTQGLQIPPVLIQQRIPERAAYELREAFKYVIKKYGL